MTRVMGKLGKNEKKCTKSFFCDELNGCFSCGKRKAKMKHNNSTHLKAAVNTLNFYIDIGILFSDLS